MSNDNKIDYARASKFPFPILAVIAFLFIGYVWGLWHPGWLVFLTIPVYYGTVEWLAKRQDGDNKSFMTLLPYPMVITSIYLLLGFLFDLWHPTWLIFLTIPIWAFFADGSKNKDSDSSSNDSDLDM